MKLEVAHVLRGPEFELEHGPFTVTVDGATVGQVSRSEKTQAGGIQAGEVRADDVRPNLLMPALVNAHDHGYGLPPLSVGAPDDALECWIPGLANRPDSDPRLEAQVAFGRMALAGIGTTVHCHNVLRRDRLAEEAEAVAAAASAVGIRVAFSCPIADRNPIVYGDASLLAGCGYPKDLLEDPGKPMPDGARQISNAVATRDTHQSETFNVQLGPIGPQWCSEATLERIARTSSETGMRIHMHLLETERQRQWLDKEHDGDPVGWLDRIGLLSSRLTVAHGVWLRPAECALLATRGVTVAVNSSSNLRLRSGIAPVSTFQDAGLRFAVGLDGGALDDDQDLLREMRLFKRLQSGMGLVDAMPQSEVFRRAVQTGFGVFAGDDDYGTIEPGSRADLMAIDVSQFSDARIHEHVSLVDLVFARADSSHVRTLLVDGRPVVHDGRLAAFDFVAAEQELIRSARLEDGPGKRGTDALNSRRQSIREYYLRGHHLD